MLVMMLNTPSNKKFSNFKNQIFNKKFPKGNTNNLFKTLIEVEEVVRCNFLQKSIFN